MYQNCLLKINFDFQKTSNLCYFIYISGFGVICDIYDITDFQRGGFLPIISINHNMDNIWLLTGDICKIPLVLYH
jgi:hypothetical protein